MSAADDRDAAQAGRDIAVDAKGLWTPPVIRFEVHELVGDLVGLRVVEGADRVEFTAHHVTFWQRDRLMLALLATRVVKLTQDPTGAES